MTEPNEAEVLAGKIEEARASLLGAGASVGSAPSLGHR